MSSRQFITIGNYGGNTRNTLSIEVGRRNPRSLRVASIPEAMTLIEAWLKEEWARAENDKEILSIQDIAGGRKMKLERVTITGADDSTNIIELLALSNRYPFVEWGILVSKSSEGSYRFPSRTWANEFAARVLGTKAQVSMHVCGSWVRAMLMGTLDWMDLPYVVQVAQRVQINTHGEPHVSTTGMIRSLMDGAAVMVQRPVFREFIFQYDGVNNHLAHAAKAYEMGYRVSALYDTSAGAGKLPERWEAPGSQFPFGYAGGLGPENVVEQIRAIEDTASKCLISPEKTYWIDMERRVRTDDDSALDMGKVRRVLELCAPFIAR